MKILFTGASSFTGYWFVRELVESGHTVHAICRNHLSGYEGVRRQRIEALLGMCNLTFGCAFGSKSFLTRLKQESYDLFCHHAAEAHQYKSAEFDCVRALSRNAKNLHLVLDRLDEGGCKRIILTGSVFEPREGGDPHSKALSPYGLSKSMTADLFEIYAKTRGISVERFIIPNPFGPYEEFRFTSYLAHNWLTGKIPSVATPEYIRDNIPVDLLAKAYVQLIESPGRDGVRPSGYVESQGEFTNRFSLEMEKRFFLPCPYVCKEQTEFLEPLRRVNAEKPNVEWEEAPFWDRLADYYLHAWRN